MISLVPVLLIAAVAGDCPAQQEPAIAGIASAVQQAAQQSGDPCGGPISIGSALRSVRDDAQRRALANALASAFASQLGRTDGAAIAESLLRDPDAAGEALAITVPQFVAAFQALQAVADARGGAAPLVPPAGVLPDGVDLADAPSFFDAVMPPPAPLAGNIRRGELVPDLPEHVVRQNRALSEVMDRLTRNAGSADKFGVTYRGRRYEDVGSLLSALEKSGHRVTARTTKGVANFFDLTLDRGDGTHCEIRTPVMIRTGLTGPDDREIAVPAVHSGMIFEVAGPDVTAGVNFYQGLYGTSFTADGLWVDQSWVGRVDGTPIDSARSPFGLPRSDSSLGSASLIEGARAIEAASAASSWMSLVEGIADERRLVNGGYGRTGFCNDSVAVIEVLLGGRATSYPLVADRALLLESLDARIAANPGDAMLRRLRDATAALPSDRLGGASDRAARIVDSIPFGPGPTPYRGFDILRSR